MKEELKKSEADNLLKQILEILQKNENRIAVDERFAEGDELIKKIKDEGEEASNKIQTYFDRIHDKLFTINGILVASYFGFGKFPLEDPIISLWLATLPICVLFYLVFLEHRQMEIFRHTSQRMQWDFKNDVDKYGKMIQKQNLRSLLAIIVTLFLALFLAVRIIVY